MAWASAASADPTGVLEVRSARLALGLALAVAVVLGLPAVWLAFSHPYTVQDDARIHLFWMRRFLDPDLFPGDLIADYFQTLSPLGVRLFYRLPAGLGIDPMLAAKVVPLLLALVATGYVFGLAVRILPSPAAGFFAAVLLNQNFWLDDDLASATPRAFMSPLLLALLYYLVRRSLLPCLAAAVLIGAFYPPAALLAAGLLGLRAVTAAAGGRGWWNRWDTRCGVLGAGGAVAGLLPEWLALESLGPLVPLDQARQMSEFSEGGRVPFFVEPLARRWLYGELSGFFPFEWWWLPYGYFLVVAALGAGLPLLRRLPGAFPGARLTAHWPVLPQLVLVSLGLFLLAHLLLFRLYMPSRYSQQSLRIVMAVAGGVVLAMLADGARHRLQRSGRLPGPAVAVMVGLVLLLYPAAVRHAGVDVPQTAYVLSRDPAVHAFLLGTPRDTLIASLDPEANNVPSFSRRAVLVAREYAVPHHVRFYQEIDRRASALIRTQYSPELAEVQRFIREHGVDFWLVHRARLLSPVVPGQHRHNAWIRQFQPAARAAEDLVATGRVPVLARLAGRCLALATAQHVLLRAECILAQDREPSGAGAPDLPGGAPEHPEEGLGLPGQGALAGVDHVQAAGQGLGVGEGQPDQPAPADVAGHRQVGQEGQAHAAFHHPLGRLDRLHLHDHVGHQPGPAEQALAEGPVAGAPVEEDQRPGRHLLQPHPTGGPGPGRR